MFCVLTTGFNDGMIRAVPTMGSMDAKVHSLSFFFLEKVFKVF